VLRAGVCIVALLSVPAVILWWKPGLWIGLFSHDPEIQAVGAAYFRLVGPSYPFVAVSMVLAFAFQGLGRATIPLAWMTIRVIGVQAERADAFARSWKGDTRIVGEKADTFAEGMATRVTFDLTFGILKQELDDIVSLSEEELAEGVRLALRATHNLAEGAGAAPLMAAMKLRDQLAGKKVVCVMSGGNIDQRTLRKVLA
jgi:hypothetical protein